MADEPDDEVQGWFDSLSFKLKKELAGKIKEQADDLADAIKSAAPVNTGALRDSVKVRRKRNELDLEVTAGGDTTVKQTASGFALDYSRFIEFGAVGHPAEPFFFSTAREMMPEIQQNIEDAVAEVLSKA